MTANNLTVRTYQRLAEAQTLQNRLGCASVPDATRMVRQALVTHLGLRRFLGTLLDSYTKESAAGWIIEFKYGRHQITIEDPDLSILEALAKTIEGYPRQDEWPTGLRRGNTYIEL